MPIDPVSHPNAILDPVVSWKTVEREEVGIFQINRTAILIGNRKIAKARGQNHLNARHQCLFAAQNIAHKRPFNIERCKTNRSALPAGIAAIDGRFGESVLVRMKDIAPGKRGQGQHLAERRDPL